MNELGYVELSPHLLYRIYFISFFVYFVGVIFIRFCTGSDTITSITTYTQNSNCRGVRYSCSKHSITGTRSIIIILPDKHKNNLEQQNLTCFYRKEWDEVGVLFQFRIFHSLCSPATVSETNDWMELKEVCLQQSISESQEDIYSQRDQASTTRIHKGDRVFRFRGEKKKKEITCFVLQLEPQPITDWV